MDSNKIWMDPIAVSALVLAIRNTLFISDDQALKCLTSFLRENEVMGANKLESDLHAIVEHINSPDKLRE